MEIFKILKDEGIGFLGVEKWIAIFKSGDYSSLLTLDGILSAIGTLTIFSAIVYRKKYTPISSNYPCLEGIRK